MDTNGPSSDERAGTDPAVEPAAAAEILRTSTVRAQRAFDPAPAYLVFTQALVIAACYATLSLSVHGQRPYTGPSLGALAILYGLIAADGIFVGAVHKRATRGIVGPSRWRMQVHALGPGLAWFANIALQGALHRAGATHSVVYGIVPSAGPWLFIGAALVASAVAHDDRPVVWGGVAAMAIGLAGLYSPATWTWAVVGTGLTLLSLVVAVASLRVGRAARAMA